MARANELGVFAPNDSARDFRFRGELTSTEVQTGANKALTVIGTLRISWAKGWSFPDPPDVPVWAGTSSDCILLVVTKTITVAGAKSWVADLTTPWGTDSTSGAGDPPIFRIELDDAQLTLDADCDGFTFACGDLRWYSGASTLEGTFAGPHTQTDTGYDRRSNTVYGDGYFQAVARALGAPTCAGVAAMEEAAGAWLIGGQYYDGAWTSWTSRLDLSMAPPTVNNDCTGAACGCVGSFSAVLPLDPFDSWDVEIGGGYHYEMTDANLGNQVCDCPSGSTGSYTFAVHLISVDHWYHRNEVWLYPEDAQMFSTRRSRFAECDCHEAPLGAGTRVDTTGTEATTYSGLYRYSHEFDATKHCCTYVSGSCIPDDPELPGPILTCDGCWPPTLCSWTGQVVLDHPTVPPCAGRFLTYDVSESQRHARIALDGSGFLVTQLSANLNTLSWSNKASTLTADWGCVRWTPIGTKQALVLWTEEAGAIKQRISYDEGGSWSVASTIEAGPGNTKPTGLIAKDRMRFIYWIDGTEIHGQIRDAGDNTLHATFTAYAGPVDNDAIAVDERVTSGGKRQFVLQCVVSGAVTELYSTDGQTFA